MRTYKLYLKDILEAMDSIESFVEGMDQESFQKDDKTSSAVIRKFEVIGEAAKQVPPPRHPRYRKEVVKICGLSPF